jgi:hypothetical protein
VTPRATKEFHEVSLAELIGVTSSGLFDISYLRKRSFPQEDRRDQCARVPNIAARIRPSGAPATNSLLKCVSKRKLLDKGLEVPDVGARGDHAAGALTSMSCFSGFEVSRAYRILATILANLSYSRESHSGGFAVLCSAFAARFTSYLASSSRTRMAHSPGLLRKLPESGFQTRRGGSKMIAQAAFAALRRVRGSEVVQHIQRPRRRLCGVGPKGLGY